MNFWPRLIYTTLPGLGRAISLSQRLSPNECGSMRCMTFDINKFVVSELENELKEELKEVYAY